MLQRSLASFILLAAVSVPLQSASAQVPRNPSDVIATGTSYKVFAQPGEPTVQVLVLGAFSSGIYVVGASTDLMELMALSGAGASVMDDDQYVRNATIRLMREQGTTRSIVYEEDMANFLAQPASYPTLENGDIFTVEVQQRERFGFRQALDLTSRLASIALLILRLASI